MHPWCSQGSYREGGRCPLPFEQWDYVFTSSSSVWTATEIAPEREADFALADGTLVRRHILECYIVLLQGEGPTLMVLGEPGDEEALLGVVMLEILGLVFNPFSRTLQPMRLLLA